MRNETTNHEPANAAMSIGRRRALRQIGLLAAAAYSAPVLLQVSQARASGGSGGGSGGGGTSARMSA